jgi:hypothetical protein
MGASLSSLLVHVFALREVELCWNFNRNRVGLGMSFRPEILQRLWESNRGLLKSSKIGTVSARGGVLLIPTTAKSVVQFLDLLLF